MTPDAWITLGVIAVALFLLVTERTIPALVVLGADVALLLAGVVDHEGALSGFSNPAPFTVASLYVVARGVEKTGGVQALLQRFLGPALGLRSALVRLLLPVAAFSGLLNNTPIVATMVPQVSAWATRHGKSASELLMPLSFAAILGGLLTLIGTSTTIVINGLMVEAGMEPMGFFEIGRVGLPVAVAGLAYLIVASPALLPDRSSSREQFEERVREFAVQMVVEPGGALDGATVEAAGLRALERVFLVEVRRDEEVVAPAAPTTVLHGGDILVFAGQVDHVLDLEMKPGLVSAERPHAVDFHDAGHTYFEAVIGETSPLAGSTLKEMGFRRSYQAAVLAIHRAGAPVPGKLGRVTLRPGDTLLLLSDLEFKGRWAHRSDFLLISSLDRLAPANPRQAAAVTAVLLGVVGVVVTGLLPILQASMAAAILLLVLRILTPFEARRAVDLNVVVLIAASFGLGAAVQESGLAEVLAGGIMDFFGAFGTRAVILGVALTALVLTEVITNNAAAILVFPVAVATAEVQGMDPRVLALTVAVAASASFLTPLGYQTNTMVYGAAGYRFSDFGRLGGVLTLIVLVVLVAAAPVLW